MTSPSTLVEIARTFHQKHIRWLVVGGYATIAHGYVRATHDLDIVLDLEPANAAAALEVLIEMGFMPRAPVPMRDFAIAENRRSWMEDREMIVFTVWREGSAGFEQVDLFLREPFDMTLAWQDRHVALGPDDVPIVCVDRDRLLAMKAEAGRPKDLEDIAQLRKISE
jgi:hypothetical protein